MYSSELISPLNYDTVYDLRSDMLQPYWDFQLYSEM